MDRKTITTTRKRASKPSSVRAKRTRAKATKGLKPRAFLNSPELRWVDSLLRSFQAEASPEWIPSPYQILLKTHARRYRKPRVLH